MSKIGRQSEGFLIGKRVYLRDLLLKDVRGPYSRWLNDAEVCRFNQHARFPISKQELEDYVRSSKNGASRVVFAVIDQISGRHVGNISLQNINFIDRSAEVAIIIGDKRYWGKGIGLEAWKLMMNYGFRVLNLHRLYCGCANKNLGMRKIAQKSGMKPEGRRRDAFFKNGGYDDILEFGILETEYLP